MSVTTGTFPGVRIADMPDLGTITDNSSLVGEHAGSGRFSAPALRAYATTGAVLFVTSVAALRALATGAASVFVQGYYAAGDGGGGEYVLGAAGADNGGSIVVSGAGTYYLQTHGAPLNVLQFGAKGDGTTDDAVAIQNCINAVQAAGGGIAAFPARQFAHAATLVVSQSGVRLVGSGYDAEHDYTPAWPTNANTRPVTALLWTGANGGDQIAIRPSGDADSGGALGGCAVLNMNLFAGTYPYVTAAAHGVAAAALKDSEFEFFALEHKTAGLFFTYLNRSAAWNNGVSFCRVPYLGYRGVAATAGSALRMEGFGGVGNAYNNLFGLVNVLHLNGDALDLYDCDNNVFEMTRIQRAAGGVGWGVHLRSGATADTPARANIFRLLSPGHGGVYSDASGAFPAFENKIDYYNPDEDSAPAIPAIGNGSTLYYNTTKQSGACYFSASLNADQSIPSGAWTRVLFNTPTIDPATWYDAANQRWQPRYPGVFNISASVALNISVNAGSQEILVYKNGSVPIVLAQRIARGTGTESIAVHGSVFLNGTTDYIEVQVFQDSTAAATAVYSGGEADATFFMGSRAA